MTKRFLTNILIISILTILSGCTSTNQNPADFGNFDGNRYINTLFGLSIKLPEDWHVLNKQQIEAMGKVAKLAAGNNEKLQKQYEMQMKRTSMLVTAFMYPIPKTGGYNPSFSSTAENLKYYPGVKSGKEYLELVRRSNPGGQVSMKFPEDIRQTDINGAQFYMLPIESTAGGYRVYQKYFVTSIKGYLLTFMATYETKNDYEKMETIFKSIKIKK